MQKVKTIDVLMRLAVSKSSTFSEELMIKQAIETFDNLKTSIETKRQAKDFMIKISKDFIFYIEMLEMGHLKFNMSDKQFKYIFSNYN